MEYTLYMHINKENGCRYIGITKNAVSQRWHRGGGYRQAPRFYGAIKTNGWDGFYHIVVKTGLDKETAEQMEQQYIAMYHADDPKYGYNIEHGGRYGRMSDQQKQHIHDVMLGKKQSKETKQKRSRTMKMRDYSFMIGRKLSETTKKRMGETKRGTRNPRAKAIEQYTLDGAFIARYETMNDAAAAVGLKRTSHISRCCSGSRNKCAGYVWRYAVNG